MELTEILTAIADAIATRVAAQIGQPVGARTTKRLFTIVEAAEYIGRTPKAVERLVQRGVIPVTKIDSKRQVDRVALDKIIMDRTYFEAK